MRDCSFGRASFSTNQGFTESGTLGRFTELIQIHRNTQRAGRGYPFKSADQGLGLLGVRSGRVFEDLLNVHVHLPEHSRRHGAAISFVAEKRHAVLNADGLKNRLGDSEGETVERPDQNDAVVTLDFRVQTAANRGCDLAEDPRRDVFGALIN